MSGFHVSRRHFFYGTLLAGAVPTGGYGTVPSLKAAGFKTVLDKLNIAAIGMGTRGPQVLIGMAASENIVALCDPDEVRAARGFAQYPNAPKYKDYRKLLEKEAKNIDAVMIATPDHTHTVISLAAMQLGKHVYCEKPLTRTVSEARLLAAAALKYKVATQMGNQGFNHEGTKTACEIVWSGGIGDVKEVHAWTGGIYGGYPLLPEGGPGKMDVPATLDWDLWLGPAAMRDFHPVMTSQWRAFLDYSTGGSMGDWLVHNLGPTHLALQLGSVSPTSIECVEVEMKSKYVWPYRAHVRIEFPSRGAMPPVTVNLYQNMRGDFQNPAGMAEGERLFPMMGNLATEKNRPFLASGDGTFLTGSQLGVDGKSSMPPRPAGPPQGGPPQGGQRPAGPPPGMTPEGYQRFPAPPPSNDPRLRAPGNGAVLIGSKGHMATTSRGEGVWLLPKSKWEEYKLPPQILPRGINHQQDWIRACKGGTPGVSDFAVATRYIEWLALGAIALQVPGKLLWDGKAGRFTNNAEANRLLTPFARKGWETKL